MPTITSILDHKFRQAIQAAFGIDTDPIVTPAQNEKFGDYQANAAMSLAKTVSEKTGQKTNPRQIADQIKAKLDLGDIVSEVSIAGPGFINVKLNPVWLASLLQQAGSDPNLGIEKTTTPQTVVVDYSGPNIAKELHVGHLRSTIIGDAVVRILDFQGHRVIKQNHIGDWGTQFGKVILAIWYIANAKDHRHDFPQFIEFAKELTTRQRTAEHADRALKETSKDAPADRRAQSQADYDRARAAVAEKLGDLRDRHEQDYQHDREGNQTFAPFLDRYQPDLDEILPIYQMVSLFDDIPEAAEYQVSTEVGPRSLASLPKLITSWLQRGSLRDQQELDAWWKVREATLDECHHIYKRLGVMLTRLDEYGESRYNPLLPRIVADLRAAGLAVESQGAVAVFIDGPDKPPLVIEKAGGEGYLYGTTDLAAIWYRVQAIKANRVIYLVDARQAHHFNQVFPTAKKAGWADDALLEHASFGTMLGEDGKPFKTRSGDTVKLKDLLDEAEERALKLVTEKNPDLPQSQRHAIAHAVGIGAVKYSDLSKDRTSDYVFSWDKALAMDGNTAPYLQYAHARIQSIFRKGGVASAAQSSELKLDAQYELSLAKHILRFGEVVALVARELKPHHLTNYLYELATKFSSFYENCPVLQSEEPTRSSRLTLCRIVANTLAKGLDLLGIEHPEQM
jgi:arginyl-tRNA synthetase